MKFDVTFPDGESGDWKVETFTISEQEARFANMRAAFGHPLEAVEPGTYKKLTHRGSIVMSNTPMEVRTHLPIIREARGKVLLNGLGLGAVLGVILQKPKVEHVTIVEKSKDVIQLVAPAFKHSKVSIIHGDAFTYKHNGARFDAAWHDIWNDICEDNLSEMTKLTRRHARFCAWQGCWSRTELKLRLR